MTAQEHPPATRFFRLFDLCFVTFLVAMLALVCLLGHQNYVEGQKSEAVRETALNFVKWLEAGQRLRDAGQPLEPAACARGAATTAGGTTAPAGFTWHECLHALQGPGQPLAGLRNLLDPRGLVFSGKCDRAALGTKGSIVVEKGLLGVNGTAQVIAYAPIVDHDSLRDEVLLRVSVCGRGFMTLGVAELKF